jgi:hypothetical protein
MKVINTRELTLAVGLCGLLAQTSCKQNQFQSNQKISQPVKVSQSVSCSDEKSVNIRLKNKKTNEFVLSKSCSLDASTTKTPADIVFVIDITGSMEDSLNTVKNGVEQFALRLRQDKGWDARFAAVGYRDAVVSQIAFADEKTLTQQIQSWEADGGRDPQEAGQQGLKTALDIITADSVSNPARANASKTILYIADAVAYAPSGLHSDFSTNMLEESFSKIPQPLKSQLRFYHSTAKEVDQCLETSIFGCTRKGKSPQYAAYPQISQFAQRIALPGKGFEFPFSESILLNEFVDEFTPEQSCVLTGATVKDKSGKELGRISNEGRFETTAAIAAAGELTFEVDRCCSAAANKPSSETESCKTNKTTFTVKPD